MCIRFHYSLALHINQICFNNNLDSIELHMPWGPTNACMDWFQKKKKKWSTVEFSLVAPNMMKDLVTQTTFLVTGALFLYLKVAIYQWSHRNNPYTVCLPHLQYERESVQFSGSGPCEYDQQTIASGTMAHNEECS